MQLHTLTPKTKRKKGKRIGRGGKRGTTAGRGTKGQRARSGHKIRPEIRDVLKKIPKLRGRGKHSFKSFAPATFVFNLNFIKKHFQTGETVSMETLRKRGFVPKTQSPRYAVKILSDGAIDKKFVFRGVGVSRFAREKILQAGGTIVASELKK
ncbi:MAG: uL15 family ribosomal protein [Patescibacteria group bacterium]